MKENQKVIVREVDLDRNLCIKIKEVKALLDHYPLCHHYRLQFALLAVTGMRGCELQNLKAKDFTQDFSKLTYRIYKPKQKIGVYTINITYKKRCVTIPNFLRSELKEFVRRNYHIMKDGYFFCRTSPDALRKQLSRIRERVKKGILKGTVWQGFLEEVDSIFEYDYTPQEKNLLKELEEKEGFTLQKEYKSHFRINLHSFRRFYLSFNLWQRYKGDLLLSSKDIGHSKVNTSYIYVYSPDKIGLPKGAKERHTFDYFFAKGKTLLNDEEDITVSLPSEMMESLRTICQKDHISENAFIRKALYNKITT